MVEVRKLLSLVSRNTKCYFKDKVAFLMSMITPLILLFLFITFLRNVYIDAFKSAIPPELLEAENVNRVLNGLAGAWLMSSILSVSSVTVAFCSNTILIEDKISSAVTDFNVSPVKSTTISIGYAVSNIFVTFIVMMVVMIIGHIYLGAVGWYISVGDFFMIIVNCICSILFGTLLAGIVENFISTQGGLSAVATLVSSMYGFICGAYMPISSFSGWLQNIIAILPGTYSVGILRNSYMGGYLDKLSEMGSSVEAVEGLKDGFDANLYAFGTKIPLGGMYGILLGTCVVLFVAFVIIVILKSKKK